MDALTVFIYCWLSMICGFFLGCAWRSLFKHSTDAEIRLAHHTRADEHAQDYE